MAARFGPSRRRTSCGSAAGVREQARAVQEVVDRHRLVHVELELPWLPPMVMAVWLPMT